MDTFITIISWIGGIGIGFVLMMAVLFASAGAAQTKSSDLKITTWVASLLLLWLVWTGISSLSSSDTSNVVTPAQTTHMQTTQVQETGTTPAPVKSGILDNDLVMNALYVLYVLAVLAFFSWLFTPSKSKKAGKDLVRKKFLASATLQEDEKGLKPWHPDWDSHASDDNAKS